MGDLPIWWIRQFWICLDGTEDEDHDWKYKSDWYGDPNVINGTQAFYTKECRYCGKEEDCSRSLVQRAEPSLLN